MKITVFSLLSLSLVGVIYKIDCISCNHHIANNVQCPQKTLTIRRVNLTFMFVDTPNRLDAIARVPHDILRTNGRRTYVPGHNSTAARDIIFEAAQHWGANRIAVACSGNFTIERVLYAAGYQNLYGCDVSIYTCALGAYLARKPFRMELREEYRESLDWMSEGLDTPVGAVATLMLLTGFARAITPHPNAYYRRLLDGYRQQWPTLMEKTVNRLEGLPLQLDDFHAGDAVDWVKNLPADVPVLSFPPFFAGGYAKMWAVHETVFDWDAPTYGEIFDDHLKRFMTGVTSREHWLLGSKEKLPDLAPHLRGITRTTNRGMPIYLYSPHCKTRVVSPRQNITPVKMPRLGPRQKIGERLALVPLTAQAFGALRSQYLNPSIPPASAGAAWGVAVDGLLVGCFAFQFGFETPGASRDTVYLLSDFAVAPTDYRRLSKLVLYAARSREAQLLAERMGGRRIRHVFTTAFTDNPVSMKYRGLFDLYSRKEIPDAEHRFALNYTAPIGSWTLDEGFKEWQAKHSQTIN